MAVVWANLDIGSYDRVAHSLPSSVNDIGMGFFFALAAKLVVVTVAPDAVAGWLLGRAE